LKKLKFILLFFFIFISGAAADVKFPLMISNDLKYSDGKLLVDTANMQFYLVKPNWTNVLEIISTWNGLDNQNKISKNPGNIQIQKSFILNGNLILLALENDNLHFIELDSELNLINNLIIANLNNSPGTNAFDLVPYDTTHFFLRVNESLYSFIKNEDLFIYEIKDEKVNSFNVIEDNSKPKLALIENFSDFNMLKVENLKGEVEFQLRLSSGEINNIQQFNDLLLVTSYIEGANSTLLEVVNLKKREVTFSDYFDVQPENLAFSQLRNGNVQIACINHDKESIRLNLRELQNFSELVNYSSIKLNEEINEPISLVFVNNLYFALFRNYIIAFNEDLVIQLNDFVQLGKNFKTTPNLKIYNNSLLISSTYYSEVFNLEQNQYWMFYSLLNYISKYIVPLILLLFIYIYYMKFRKQKRLLREITELPSSGLMIILNKTGEISRINKQARDLLGIESGIPLNKHILEYFTLAFTSELKAFVIDGLLNNLYITKKIMLRKENQNFEFVFSFSPIWSTSGSIKGYLLNGYNITEQLERKRISNWAQLAHDMQTNLLTIKLNAEQLHSEENAENQSRLGKILHQVNLLQRRVRDIVTVGRSNKLELVRTSAEEIFNEVTGEFDATVFPTITINMNYTNFDLFCDKPKLIRAIRNAIENGIKAIPDQKGRIDLSSWTDSNYYYFQIKDNGVGMDEELKKKILTPYFTTSKDGSGFGLGTMIIQQVVELHYGKLNINSEKGKGTELIIKIPKNIQSKSR